MESVQRFIYGPTPEEKVRKWQSNLRTEERRLDREVRQLDVAQANVKKQMKQLAQRGDVKNAKTLAREVVRSSKQRDRIVTSQARLGSIRMQLQHQLATIKITGTLEKSTEIMKLSNQLIQLPQLNKTMQDMSREMMKAGLISEMVDDTLESLDEDQEELEEEAEIEVENVLFQITDGKLGQAGKVSSGPLPNVEVQANQNDAEDVEKMQDQLNSLLNS